MTGSTHRRPLSIPASAAAGPPGDGLAIDEAHPRGNSELQGGSPAGYESPVTLRPTFASGLPLMPVPLYCLLFRILDDYLDGLRERLYSFVSGLRTLPVR